MFKMSTKEIQLQEQLNDLQEAGLRLGERMSELESRENKTNSLVIPDYSIELNTIINELRNNNKNEEVSQLLSMVTSIQESIKKQPVTVNRVWRILLFPESRQAEYYKIVFGRLIPWGFGFVIATYIFIAGYKAIGIYRYNQDASESVHYEKAWHYLEKHAKKRTVDQMKEAFSKTDDK
jgi:hypothetical protein